MNINPISLISIGISLLVMGFNCAMFIVIKFNDMRHLSKSVDEIKIDVKTIILETQKQAIEIATQKEHCKIMHKRGRRSIENKTRIEE